MDVQVKHKNTENLNPTAVLQQSKLWSEIKKKQGICTKAFRFADCIDDFLILTQDIGGNLTAGYIPYGPEYCPPEEEQGIFLEELSESLKPRLPENCIFIRYDLLWESPWAKDMNFFDSLGNWTGPPEKKNQELRLNFSTKNWNLKKANTNILPPNTVFLDIGKSEKQLLEEMKPKTRYNIRLAEKKGITVKAAGREGLETWYSLYRETCMRNSLYTHSPGYFNAVFDAKKDADMDYSGNSVELLAAFYRGKPAAAMFLAFSGTRATYLYGASSSENRNLMASYALQWEAVRYARKKGLTEYDMFGIAPSPDPAHPLYGLYRFKTGFGGHIFHRMGCWDYPLDIRKYEIYQAAEINHQGYHIR